MERIGLREFRQVVRKVVDASSRVVLTRNGRDVAGVVPASEAKLLERLERAGELGGLKERYPEEV